MDDTATARLGFHLPAVDPRDSEEVLRHFLAAADALPEFSFVLSRNEADRIAEELQHRRGPLRPGEMLRVVGAVVETLFDDETSYSPALHAQLVLMLQFPSVPEAVSTQVAFGREMGEASAHKIEKLAVAARKLGRNMDEHVAVLEARGEIEHDLPVKCFRGESSEVPDTARMRRTVALFRTTAALCPEPFRPSVLCVIAWMLWALGKRPIALAYLRMATAIDPQHPLAFGLTEHLRDHQPEWIVAGRASAQRGDCA